MTNHTPKRRLYNRRYRHVYVTTIRSDRSPEGIARVVTNIALGQTQREADARVEHQARLARDRALESPARQPLGEGAGDA
ncbi:hypothetical protein [Planctomonas deserti]|uniref:hypothetical protein n=1 Tax=Planctomonas deserti TaxID=2144185 RepID=UPI00131F3C17|nr:hypothetical protein [Planctomonas deserti]